MSLLPAILPFLEIGATLSALGATVITLWDTRKALRAKRTLKEVAKRDDFVSRELVKFYRDKELSDADVRALVRAMSRAIEKDIAEASIEARTSLNSAKALVLEEAGTKGHRLFKEIAEEANSRSLPAS